MPVHTSNASALQMPVRLARWKLVLSRCLTSYGGFLEDVVRIYDAEKHNADNNEAKK
jgi:hypothetical protein